MQLLVANVAFLFVLRHFFFPLRKLAHTQPRAHTIT